MRAIVHTIYGPPEVAKVMEVPKPAPKSNEVLVKVHASTVNRTDSGFRSAEYFVSRMWSGLFRPKHQTLGCEFAGVVEATGEGVTDFKVGDRVFGFNDATFGGHAEFLTIPESWAIAVMPGNATFAQAAAISEGAHYALNNIRASKIKKGQHAMVYGATGAIGSAAVQLLKYLGVVVTAVCNTKNVALVKNLGADRVIDYQTEDFTKTNEKFHFIFDAVGKSSFKECKPLLTESGIYVSTELGKNGENIFLALVTPLFGKKRVIFPIPKTRKEDVLFLKQRVEEGTFMPVIDREYKLEQIVEAYRYVETGQKTGNVILTIIDEQ
ncbi:MAG: NAD(P)-dependent alcohol dehydrogenase [Bacteroidales bacterium]|nr:NAD(P)-dependent alcohol dehydrogenase [Bacteroidales bacterium]